MLKFESSMTNTVGEVYHWVKIYSKKYNQNHKIKRGFCTKIKIWGLFGVFGVFKYFLGSNKDEFGVFGVFRRRLETLSNDRNIIKSL